MSTVVTTGLRHTSYAGNNIILDSSGAVYAAGVVNATSYTTGATGTGTGGLIANTTVVFLGNNTVNATINTTSLKIGGTFGLGGANALQGEFNATGLTVYASGVTPQHDGPLHVMSGSAGTWSPNSSGDELIVESSGSGGISIATPDASVGYLMFSSPTVSGAYGGLLQYQYSSGIFVIENYKSGGTLQFRPSDGSARGEWNTTGLTCYASGVTPQHDGVLHVMSGSAGAVTAPSDADELVIEGSNGSGLTVLGSDVGGQKITLGSASLNEGGGLAWNYNSNVLYVQTNRAGSAITFRPDAGSARGEWNTTGLTCFASGVTPQHDHELHVMDGTSGVYTATSATQLVVESDGAAGIQLMGGNGANNLFFGRKQASGAGYGYAQYSEGTGFEFGTVASGEKITFLSGAGTTALTLDSSQIATFTKGVVVNPSVGNSARATAIALTVSSRTNFTTYVGQYNPAISTVAAILDVISTDAVGIVTVRGESAGNKFADCVFFHANGAVALSSGTVGGTPAARTYTVNSGILRLAMASGTYTVAVGGTITYQ